MLEGVKLEECIETGLCRRRRRRRLQYLPVCLVRTLCKISLVSAKTGALGTSCHTLKLQEIHFVSNRLRLEKRID